MIDKDRVYLKHILDCIHLIMSYTDGMSEQEFISHLMAQDAVIRNFEIIGEATKLISEPTRIENNAVPWKKMAGMRDKLIHDYMGVDLEVIWKTIHDILPSLEKDIENILNA
mgnify:CR=1 FL=1